MPVSLIRDPILGGPGAVQRTLLQVSLPLEQYLVLVRVQSEAEL